MDTKICHKCGAELASTPGRGRARCSICVRTAQARREKEGRELTAPVSYATFRKVRAAAPADSGFRINQKAAAITKTPTLFDQAELSAEEIEAGLSEYRASRVSAQSLARRWGCEIEAVYASDIEFTRRLKRREREVV